VKKLGHFTNEKYFFKLSKRTNFLSYPFFKDYSNNVSIVETRFPERSNEIPLKDLLMTSQTHIEIRTHRYVIKFYDQI